MEDSKEFLKFRRQATIFVVVLLAVIIYANGCLGQYPKIKRDIHGKTYNANQTIDSTKYYWKKAVELSNKGIPDSCNKYLIILNKSKKK